MQSSYNFLSWLVEVTTLLEQESERMEAQISFLVHLTLTKNITFILIYLILLLVKNKIRKYNK